MHLRWQNSYNKYIVFGVLLFRLWYALYFLVYGNDTISQQFAADQLLTGYGITHPVMDAVNPESVIYQPMAKWPLTLTFFQALFYGFFSDWILVSQILTSIAVILFFFITGKTMHLLRFSSNTQLMLWILVLTNPLLFHDFGVSDWLGLTAFAGGFYYLGSFVLNPNRNYSWIFWASFIFYVPAFFKYQYYPLILVFPAAALYWSWQSGNQSIRKKAGVLCFSAVGLLLLQIGFFHWYSGGIGYPFSSETGWYWSNLLKTDPFLVKSVFRADYFIFKVPALSDLIRFIFLFLSAALFLAVVVVLYKKKKAIIREQAVFLFLQWVMLLFAGFCFLFLAFLSLRNPPVAFGFMNLNFVGETRYYSPVMYLLMLLFLYLYQQNSCRITWRLASGTVLLCNVLLWIKFLFNVPELPAPVSSLQWAVADRAAVRQVLQKEIPDSAIPVVLSWLPTEYIVLNKVTSHTYILKNYEQLLTQELSDRCHYVFAAELTYLKPAERILLTKKDFSEVYNDGFYVVFLRKAAVR